MSIQIREAVIDEWAAVHRIMCEAFEEYRGVLHPPSGALREELEDTIRKLSPRGGAVLAMRSRPRRREADRSLLGAARCRAPHARGLAGSALVAAV
ncbi:hypothetical protein DFQ01_11863 [Paenibacillus cellulosilyticus]|uniref:Acetyltransferase (GNAT) family protein n=1 Tax=Paenibacillus cellulosilyticus TaxID=375489 RepID=A0A2V2YQ85_9BACL|nr:hypothetical protein [Paenibacillus cellulosilyticus]PWV98428.1 hypothetical protein DFQ01_11863 [Paenibacillus cellulosilyticus]QKS43275.1 hypothetical protein HUB94_02030 [Paenibacillus cellulosilyticus]